MKNVGITTTIPVEVIFASGNIPIDLNNIFIGSDKYAEYIDFAEKEGLPKSMCAWIKGLYGACLKNNINTIVGVLEGDCSNTKVLSELLAEKGVEVVPFSYPYDNNINKLKKSIDELIYYFNIDIDKVENIREQLNLIRDRALYIDHLTYKENKASGFENHLNLVSTSDFNRDYIMFSQYIEDNIRIIEKKDKFRDKIRLAYIGVPPMTVDIYQFLEERESRIVYNEVQREFAFPRNKDAKNIYEQYTDYTYPYNLKIRLNEIKKQIKLRKIDAVIHYTQAFCHRAAENIIIKKELDVPLLNIEGDKLKFLDARTKLRIEAFIDMVKDLKVME